MDSDEGLVSADEDLAEPSVDGSDDDACGAASDLDGSSPNSDEAFKKAFADLKPRAVENLLKSIRSHELFPLFEDHEVSSSEHHDGKANFGDQACDDVLRWNAWLDEHGAS